jgi:hypothetical protein
MADLKIPKEDLEKPRIHRPTVSDLVLQFLVAYEVGVGDRAVRWYRKLLIPFTKVHGSLQVDSLGPLLVDEYARRPGWSRSTGAMFFSALMKAVQWGIAARLIDHNPIVWW